ncbi:MAG: Na+/H+ antiporter subunit E [Acidimicrobiales bacterium]
MNGLPQPRRLLMIVALVLVWCGLWGSVSVANVLGGALIAVLITSFDFGLAGNGGVRVVPLLRLTGLVLIDLVRSTISVAKEIVTARTLADEAIVAVRTPDGSGQHLLLLTALITLTPGTAVVDAEPDPDNNAATLYLHLLYRDDAEQTKAHVMRIATLACKALPMAGSDSASEPSSESEPGASL